MTGDGSGEDDWGRVRGWGATGAGPGGDRGRVRGRGGGAGDVERWRGGEVGEVWIESPTPGKGQCGGGEEGIEG